MLSDWEERPGQPSGGKILMALLFEKSKSCFWLPRTPLHVLCLQSIKLFSVTDDIEQLNR